MIPKSIGGTARFGARIDYVQKHGEAVVVIRNLLSLETAEVEMEAAASQSRRCQKPCHHVVVSWAALERPSDAQMIDAADVVLDRIGLAECQAVIAIHRDRDHHHLHIVANRVDPATGKAVHMSQEYAHLELACREIEHAQGWSQDRGRFVAEVVRDSDGNDDVRLVAKSVPVPEQRPPSQAERAYEQRVAMLPLADLHQRIAAEVTRARSWPELHARLTALGVVYEQKGSGAVVRSLGDESEALKASSVSRQIALSKVMKRLGEYQPRDVAQAQGDPAAIAHEVETQRAEQAAREATRIARDDAETWRAAPIQRPEPRQPALIAVTAEMWRGRTRDTARALEVPTPGLPDRLAWERPMRRLAVTDHHDWITTKENTHEQFERADRRLREAIRDAHGADRTGYRDNPRVSEASRNRGAAGSGPDPRQSVFTGRGLGGGARSTARDIRSAGRAPVVRAPVHREVSHVEPLEYQHHSPAPEIAQPGGARPLTTHRLRYVSAWSVAWRDLNRPDQQPRHGQAQRVLPGDDGADRSMARGMRRLGGASAGESEVPDRGIAIAKGRQPRDPVRDVLWAEYQQVCELARQAPITERDAREAARRAALRQQHEERGKRLRELLPPGIVRSVFAWFQERQHRRERTALEQQLREDRQRTRLDGRLPIQSWRQFVEQEAVKGRPDAIGVLHSLRYGKTVRDHSAAKKTTIASKVGLVVSGEIDREAELAVMRRLPIGQVAERLGYQREPRQAPTAASVKLRHTETGEVIVTRPSDGRWFSTADTSRNGDVFRLVQHARGGSFQEARNFLRPMAGDHPMPPLPSGAQPLTQPERADHTDARRAWSTARSGASQFIANRGIDQATAGLFADEVRVDARGNALFAHRDAADNVVGFEIKNDGFSGFAKGGRKALALFGPRNAQRIVVTESGLDALSVAQLERLQGRRDPTLYVSTGGAIGARALDQLADLALGRTVALALDADPAGQVMAERISGRIAPVAREIVALPPSFGKDWNEVLRAACDAPVFEAAQRDYAHAASSAAPRRRGGVSLG